MEVEIMKYWSNKFGIIDIDNFPYRIDNVIYSYNLIICTDQINFMSIYIKGEYCEPVVNSFKITSNAHIIIEVKDFDIKYQCYDEFLILNEIVLKAYPAVYSKAYIVFDTESEYLKWKLKL